MCWTPRGKPAANVRVELAQEHQVVASGETDADGRIRELAKDLDPGRYSAFLATSPFFTKVEVEIELTEGHYHVPLLVSPYGCATYRGS